MDFRGLRSHKGKSIAALVLALVLLVSLNLVSQRLLTDLRFDLTENALFTLSGSTRAVLGKIGEPITLRLYLSKRLGEAVPPYGTYGSRVRELLEQYAKEAKGKIKLEFYDPEPFSEVEDRAVGFGLQAVPIDQSGEQVFFGLAGTNMVDDQKTIPFFQLERERFIEYDLTRLVYELANPKKPVIGLITALTLKGDIRPPMPGGRPWIVYDQMSELFDIRDLGSDVDVVPTDVDVLMVAHPLGLKDKTLYAIDQYVLGGGRALFLVDPHSEAMAMRTGGEGRIPLGAKSDLNKLFSAWGFRVSTDKIAGDLRSAWRVRAKPNDPMQAVDYVAWMRLGDDLLNREDVVTGELNLLNFASSGYITRDDNAAITLTPLVVTSPQSMEVDANDVRLDPNPTQILAKFKPSGKRLVLAARVAGPVKTAFPDGPPKEEEKKDNDKDKPAAAARPGGQKDEKMEKPAPLAESKGPVSLIVVGDSDLLEDRYWVQVQDFLGQQLAVPIADNANFVINALDNLAGSSELISLRSRGVSTRPFTVVLEMRQEAELRYRATERELRDKLQEAQTKLAELERGQQQAQGGGAILTPQQREEIEKIRSQVLKFRRDLREVQRALREDIETLGRWIKFINIGLIPILVGVLAVVMGIVRVRRRARRHRIV